MTLCIYLHQQQQHHHNKRPHRTWAVGGHKIFTPEGCLSMHNELRARHQDTGSVTYDDALQESARRTAAFLSTSTNTEIDGYVCKLYYFSVYSILNSHTDWTLTFLKLH